MYLCNIAFYSIRLYFHHKSHPQLGVVFLWLCLFIHSGVIFPLISPYPQEMLRGLKQTLCTPGPRDPTETETELCLSVSCGGTGQQWTATGAGALGAAELGTA